MDKFKNKSRITPLLVTIVGTALLAFGIIATQSMTREENMILEKKDIQFFKVEQIERSPLELNITGLVMHSSYVVEKIDTSQSDDTLMLKIYLKLASFASAKSSGSFTYHLIVPETVRKVVMGKEQAVIWMRN